LDDVAGSVPQVSNLARRVAIARKGIRAACDRDYEQNLAGPKNWGFDLVGTRGRMTGGARRRENCAQTPEVGQEVFRAKILEREARIAAMARVAAPRRESDLWGGMGSWGQGQRRGQIEWIETVSARTIVAVSAVGPQHWQIAVYRESSVVRPAGDGVEDGCKSRAPQMIHAKTAHRESWEGQGQRTRVAHGWEGDSQRKRSRNWKRFLC